MNLAESIKLLKNSGQSEGRLVADFVDDLEDDMVVASCDEIIGAANMVKKAVTSPVLVIRQDSNDMDPRKDWDNLGTMVCWHRRYILGDDQPRETPAEWLDAMGPFFVKLPLYLYDHSGLTMSTGPFSCPWDSGQVGWIVAWAEDVRKAFGVKALNGAIRKRVIKILEAEVRVYDQCLRGAVWGFEYGDDGCWGFFGDELEETGLLDAIDAPRDVVEAAWEART